MKEIVIEDPTLVILVGASGAGKSTFAKKHFKPTEIVSSDHYRAVISDDENNADHDVSKDAFALVNTIIQKRLQRQLTTIVDATSVQAFARKALKNIADQLKVPTIAIVLHLPEQELLKRLKERPDRSFGEEVTQRHYQRLLNSLQNIDNEGFEKVYVLSSVEEVKQVKVLRKTLFEQMKIEGEQFDIIGDVHGCFNELKALLEKLGYVVETLPEKRDAAPHFGYQVTNPAGRRVFFVGDLVDRGDNTPEVLRLAMSMVYQGQAYCVRGNHDDKLYRKLMGRDVQVAHGLESSLEQLAEESSVMVHAAVKFLGSLVSHYVLLDGNLVIAHAGLKESLQGVYNKRSQSFAMYGATNGQKDEYGLPVRLNWAADYTGKATVVYGHTPVAKAAWLNNTIDIDTGCVFGGWLTALRYPEKEIVQVKALKQYAVPTRPIVFD